jgi:hypothetical protein
MGDDGDRLHDWRFDTKTEADAAVLDEIYASNSAMSQNTTLAGLLSRDTQMHELAGDIP